MFVVQKIVQLLSLRRSTHVNRNKASMIMPDDIPPTIWQQHDDDNSLIKNYEELVEPFTGSFVEDMLQPFLEEVSKDGNRLLDVGCGTGAVSLIAQKKGFRVTSTDVCGGMVERCRQRRLSDISDMESDVDPIDCTVANGENLPRSWSNNFDFVIGSFSVIFFSNPSRGLEEIYRCLNPGGQAVISAWGGVEETPAFRIFPEAVKLVAPDFIKNATPKRITGSVPSLTTLMEDAGFKNVKVVGPVQKILRVSSAQAYYDRFASGSPNCKAMITGMSSEKIKELHACVIELAEKRGGLKDDGSISLPSSAYFAYGTKVV